MKKLLLLLLLFPSIAFGQSAIPFSKYSFGALAGTVQTVKASAALIGGYYINNGTGATCYLQIFDIAGAPVLGTTVPDLSLGIPAGAAANIPPSMPGIGFTNAIKIAATTTRTGAVACALDVNIWYK